MSDDYYDLLGVDADAPREEVRDAYRSRLDDLKFDPNAKRGPSEAQLALIREETGLLNKAWHVLSDPYQRERYDAQLAADLDANHGSDDDAPDDDSEIEPAGFRGRMRMRAEKAQAQGGRLMPDADAAPLGRRLLAVAIDMISVVGVYAVIFVVVASQVKLDKNSAATVGLVVAAVLVLAIYAVAPTVRRGQTFGQSLTGVRVVNVANRTTPSLSTALIRYAPVCVLPAVLGQLGPVVAILLGLSFLFASNRVSLLDRLAKTRVVDARLAE